MSASMFLLYPSDFLFILPRFLVYLSSLSLKMTLGTAIYRIVSSLSLLSLLFHLASLSPSRESGLVVGDVEMSS